VKDNFVRKRIVSGTEVVESICRIGRDGRSASKADKARCHEFWNSNLKDRRFTLTAVAVAKLKTSHESKRCDIGDVGRYVDMRRDGSPFPPVLLLNWVPRWKAWRVWDGNHRVRAAQCVGDQRIAAFVPVKERTIKVLSRRSRSRTRSR